MISGILNAQGFGGTSRFGYGEVNQVALRAVDEMRDTMGGTIYISTGYETAGVTDVEITTAASGSGAVYISKNGTAKHQQLVRNNLFVMIGARDNAPLGEVGFGVLAF